MMEKQKEVNPILVQDLMKNKLVVFQDKYYLPLVISINALSIAFFGWMFNDYVGAFVLTFLTRMFLTHHSTWFINSIAHSWGVQPYSKEHSAVNNWIIAFLTLGEGYHNYHHTFTSDYRNGVRWYQYDPTKVFIWSLSKMGLAKDLKKIDTYLIQKRLLLEDKKLLLERLNDGSPLGEEGKWKIIALADRLNSKLSALRTLVRDYKVLKQEKAKKDHVRKIKSHMKALKKSIRLDFRAWGMLCDTVLKQGPSAA